MPIYKTNKKKDGLQGYRVRVAYTDSSGSHKQVERTAYGKAEALSLERSLIDELSCIAGNLPAAASPVLTVQNLYDEYTKAKASEVRTSTLDKSKNILSNHVLPSLGSLEITALDVQVLQRWKNSVNEKTLKNGKPLQIKMKQNIYRELRTMLNYAVKLEYLPANPLLKVGNFRDAYAEHPAEKLHYYTKDQFLKFIKAASDRTDTLYDWGVYVFFCIAYYTGMRKGEINALRWTDLEQDHLTVRRSVTQKLKGEEAVETPPKNQSSYRTLQVPAPLLRVLEEHRLRQQQDSRWEESWRICGGPKCISDTALANRNNEYADAAGLPRIRIHDFRHSHASLLCNEGINIQEVARRLGHSNVEITWKTYAHLYPREEERAVAILDTITL